MREAKQELNTPVSVCRHINIVRYLLVLAHVCVCVCMYQCSMCIGGTSRGGMGVAVGCGVCVAVCCSASIVVGIGKHQALAQMLG